MTQTQTDVLAKVRKLLRLADSPNAHEAALAAAKAQQLIDDYNLSTALLALDEPTAAAPDEPIENFGARLGGSALDEHYTQRWQATLASTIARANGCKVYMSGQSLQLIGRASDAEAVRYLYALIRPQVERLADREGRGMGITWRNNFKYGVVDTIAQRLRAQHATWEAEARQAATAAGTQALVRVNTALATIQAKGASVDAWTKANMRLGKASGSGATYNHGARQAGRQAGHSVRMGGGAGLTSGAKALGSGR